MAQSIATSGPYLARTAEDLTQSLMDYMVMMGTGITDFTVGSVIRTELEAIAQLAEQFYTDQATQLSDAIQQSAYSAFNFAPLISKQSTGYLVFEVDSPGLTNDTVFVAGTTWQPNGQNTLFATSDSFTIPMNTAEFWHVRADCLTLGTLGNLAGGASGNLLYPIPGVTVFSEDSLHFGAGNYLEPGNGSVLSGDLATGFIDGVDPETPLEMKTRFTAFLSSLHRSTLVALAYGASLAQLTDRSGSITEQVVLARTVDVNVDSSLVPAAGTAKVYVFNGVGSPGGQITSGALVNQAQIEIDGIEEGGVFTPGYKAAGITTEAFSATEYIASIAISVTPVGRGTALAVSEDFLRPAVVQAVTKYFNLLKIGDKVFQSAILSYVINIPGIQAATITSMSFSPSITLTFGDVYAIPTNGIAVLGSSITSTLD